MSKQAVRHRRDKVAVAEVKPSPKEKFIQSVLDIELMEKQVVPKFVPATANQKTAVNLLKGGCRMLFLQGSAGTGKSMLAAWWASCLLKEKKVDGIVLIRANVVTGKSAGSLPGTEEEKLTPFFVQTLQHLSKFLGAGYLQYCLEKGAVEIKSGEYLRGMSFENKAVLVEEAQNLTDEDLEMILTRLGKGSTYLLTGDHKQNDMRGGSGLNSTIARVNHMVETEPDYLNDEDLDYLKKLIGNVEFMPEDCVRDPLTRALVKMYYYS